MLLISNNEKASLGFTGGANGKVVKNPPANSGAMGSIAGSGRFPGVENSKLLQYSCCEKSLMWDIQR